MAADLPGAVLGSLLVPRVRSALRPRVMVPLAAATGLPLIVTDLRPAAPFAVLLWAGSGCAVQLLDAGSGRPDLLSSGRDPGLHHRIAAAAGLHTAQGLGALLAGPIAAAGLLSASIAMCRRRFSRPSRDWPHVPSRTTGGISGHQEPDA